MKNNLRDTTSLSKVTFDIERSPMTSTRADEMKEKYYIEKVIRFLKSDYDDAL